MVGYTTMKSVNLFDEKDKFMRELYCNIARCKSLMSVEILKAPDYKNPIRLHYEEILKNLHKQLEKIQNDIMFFISKDRGTTKNPEEHEVCLQRTVSLMKDAITDKMQ